MTAGPSDVTWVRGIVLDAETAALVPSGARCWDGIDSFVTQPPNFTADPGDILTHLPTPTGLRQVAELVAAHRRGKTHAARLRRDAQGDRDLYGLTGVIQDAAADFLDAQADRTIDPRLVAAYKAQHDGEVK